VCHSGCSLADSVGLRFTHGCSSLDAMHVHFYIIIPSSAAERKIYLMNRSHEPQAAFACEALVRPPRAILG